MDQEAGAYGRWRHLACWRVPASVWLGLPDPEACTAPAAFAAALERMGGVTLSGFSSLPPEGKASTVAHVMDKENWARLTKKGAEAFKAATAPRAAPPSSAPAAAAASSHAPASSSAGAIGSGAGGTSLAATSSASSSSSLVTASAMASGGRFILPRPGVNGAQENALAGQTFVITGVFPEVGGGSGLDLGKDRLKSERRWRA